MRESNSLFASLAVMAAMICTALGAALAKLLFPLVGVEGVTALRVGFSAVLLGCATRVWRSRFDRAMLVNVLAFGTALGLMNILIYQAFARIPIGIAIAIEVTGPLSVALLLSRRPLDFLWIAAAALGLGLLLPIRAGAGDLDPLGILFAFGAAACWASYIVFGRRVSALGAGHAVATGMLVASAIAVPFGLAHASASLFTLQALALGLAVAVLSSIVPYLLEMIAIPQLPQRIFGMLLSCAPAVGAGVGALVLGESLTAVQWGSILLIVGASAGSAIASPKRRKLPAGSVSG